MLATVLTRFLIRAATHANPSLPPCAAIRDTGSRWLSRLAVRIPSMRKSLDVTGLSYV
jgi:hypothetical protein